MNGVSTRRRALIVILAVLTLSACSEPSIDGSSKESLRQSIVAVRASLPEADQDRFEKALQIIAFDQTAFAVSLRGKQVDEEGLLLLTLNGKTGTDILSQADRILEAREEQERQWALAEIQALEEKETLVERNQAGLARFEVSSARFYMKKQKYFGEDPVIEIAVVNGTEEAISRAHFEGAITSPGRSVPWFKGAFSYVIPGGLQPGEKATWKLEPNRFTAWGKVDAPEDAEFTVTVVGLDGADDEPLFADGEFKDAERQRLAQLRERYAGE